MGIAGTGKTTLLSALSIYFAMLDVGAGMFVPANSNADHSTRANKALAAEVREQQPNVEVSTEERSNQAPHAAENVSDSDDSTLFSAFSHLNLDSIEGKQIRAHRLYPSSLNYGFENLSQDQAKHHQVGHVNRAVSSIHSFEFKNKSFKDRKTGARDLAIERAIRDEALKGDLSFFDELFEGEGRVEVWEMFRGHMTASDEEEFDWDNGRHKDEYSRSYDACKGHLVALTDIIVTTTGNARCSEITDHWMRHTSTYGIPSKGIALMLDESMKDSDINTLMPMMLRGQKVACVFMFGDEN
jgi:hypothetical protein